MTEGEKVHSCCVVSTSEMCSVRLAPELSEPLYGSPTIQERSESCLLQAGRLPAQVAGGSPLVTLTSPDLVTFRGERRVERLGYNN